jgi:hypothetical protein
MNTSWIDLVRKEAPLAEQQGQLTTAQLSLIRDQEWFRLLIPSSLGGKEYALPELLETLEMASWMDGSFGWVMALCGGAGFFAGFVEEPVAKTLFGNPGVCAAGTGFPAGMAQEVPGGYKVSGHWRYASGAPHATLYTANCKLMASDRGVGDAATDDPCLTDDAGQPLIRAMIFLPEQVTIQDGWQSLGLKATASQDMIVREAFVPAERSFTLSTPFPHAGGPLFRYPFHQQAEAVLSVTLLGMTRHFLDLFKATIIPLYKGISAVRIQQVFDASFIDAEMARDALYDAVAASWMPYVEGRTASAEQLKEVGKAAIEATRSALRSTDRLYPYGGMEMMQVRSEINRVWRDIHTASQHILLAPLKREG